MRVVAAFVIAAFAAPSAAFVSPRSLSSRNPLMIHDGVEKVVSSPSMSVVTMKMMQGRDNGFEDSLSRIGLASLFSLTLAFANPFPAMADGQTEKFKLPPIDFNDKNRCILNSSAMGQANAARDKLYDLRQCSLSGAKAVGFDLSGVLMTGTDVSKANFQEAYFSKGYLHDSNFEGTDFTNGIIDRASFKGSSLRGAIFQNAVLTSTSFDGADLEGADFTEAQLGVFDIKTICRNPTLKGENPTTGADTRLSVGCGPSP